MSYTQGIVVQYQYQGAGIGIVLLVSLKPEWLLVYIVIQNIFDNCFESAPPSLVLMWFGWLEWLIKQPCLPATMWTSQDQEITRTSQFFSQFLPR